MLLVRNAIRSITVAAVFLAAPGSNLVVQICQIGKKPALQEVFFYETDESSHCTFSVRDDTSGIG